MGSLQSFATLAAKGLSQATALSVLAATGLILANPGAVQAANPTCASSAKLSVYLTPCDTSNQFTFNLLPTTTFLPDDTLSVTSTSTSFTLGLLSDATWGVGTYALQYSITAPPGKLLTNYSSSLTSSVSSSNGGDAGAWDVNGANGIAGSTFSTPNGSNGNKVYSPKIASDTFSSTLTVTNGVIQGVTSTVNVVPAPPLPRFQVRFRFWALVLLLASPAACANGSSSPPDIERASISRCPSLPYGGLFTWMHRCITRPN